MKITIIGCGYVGLVTGACFAETGNHVIGVDKDAERVNDLNRGNLPIYELGMDNLVRHNLQAQRLTFTTDLAAAVHTSELIFICVGTPPTSDGSADLIAVMAVTDALADAIDHSCIVVVKSTVPIGTTQLVKERIRTKARSDFDIANNPEFLREGLAIDDFNRPDRVIVGVERKEVGDVFRELYRPFLRAGNPMIVTDPRTSEMIKYVSNAMLATKISFINEMANLCEAVGADIDQLRLGVCSDKRIGVEFMFPGIGYGGSCLPKDIPALIHTGEESGVNCRLLKMVHEVNEHQPRRMFERIRDLFKGDLREKTGAVWGTAFKAGTNDVRFSPSIAIIEMLLGAGARIRVHDPWALDTTRAVLGDRVVYCRDCYEALDGADFLFVGTDWREYRSPDFELIQKKLRFPILLDGRNIYDPERMRIRGFVYGGVGRVDFRRRGTRGPGVKHGQEERGDEQGGEV